MTREEAWDLLTEFNKEEFHLEHAQIVEQTMKYFAEQLGYGEEALRCCSRWKGIGLQN